MAVLAACACAAIVAVAVVGSAAVDGAVGAGAEVGRVAQPATSMAMAAHAMTRCREFDFVNMMSSLFSFLL